MGRAHQLANVVNQAVKDKGIFYVMKRGVFVSAYIVYRTLFAKKRYFIFRGKSYQYFYDIINNTWMNERSIEVPITMDLINRNKEKKILEILEVQ